MKMKNFREFCAFRVHFEAFRCSTHVSNQSCCDACFVLEVLLTEVAQEQSS